MSPDLALRLGKAPAVRPHGLRTLEAYVAGALPKAPPAVPPPSIVDWGVMLNDQLGDCTIAGVGHLIMDANELVSEADPIPSDDEIRSVYFDLTGGGDTGLVEADVLKAWHAGLFDPPNRLAGFAPVEVHNVPDLCSAMALFGAVYVGVALPDSALEQFQAGEPWTLEPGANLAGGHAIIFVGYDHSWLYAVSWGKVVKVSYPWWHAYGDEAWAVIPQAYTEAGHGPTVDLATLQADLGRL